MSARVRWLCAGVAAAVLAASFLWTPSRFPKLELCLLRRTTGIPCPGCGLTRAFCALSHGELAAAWGFHPFGLAFYAAAVGLVAWPFVVGRWPGIEERVTESRGVRVAAIVVVASWLGFGVVRALWVVSHRG